MTDLTQMTPRPPVRDARLFPRLARLAAWPAWISLLLAAATMVVYYPVGWFQFVALDDPLYVSSNTHVKAGLSLEGLRWALSTGCAGNWHPLTWLSHMLDAQAFGPGPTGPHIVNLLFHVASTLLLFGLLQRQTRAVWRSAFVAALFALHPLHVESVAWISERKDVLSAFFFMLTLWAYARYAECRRQKAECRMQKAEVGSALPASRFTSHVALFYLLSLLFFALGLMSKPMLVTVPFILLLLDYWPLQRFQSLGFTGQGPEPGVQIPADANTGQRTADYAPPTPRKSQIVNRILLEKLPVLFLSVLSCVVTFVAQKKGGAVQSLAQMSLRLRLENTPVAYARYLGKTLWPAGLATPYPSAEHWPLTQVLIAVALLAGLTLGAVWLGRRFRFVPVGWLWFLGMMVPVIGLVQVGEQSLADRYTYLPLIGLFIIAAWGAGEVCDRWRLPKMACASGAGLVLLACAVQARHQLGFWRDSEALYRHNLAVTRNNWLACYNLGWYLDDQKRLDEALFYYHKAIEMQPRYPDPLNNIGVALVAKKQYAEAIPYFERALKAEPGFYEAHNNIGQALEGLGKIDEAIQEYRLVLAKKPDNVGALNNLGNALARKGQFADAMQYYASSLQAKPDQAAAHHGLASTLAKLGRTDEAIQHYRALLQRNPDDASAHNDLGLVLARKGKLDEAMQEFREAVRCKPDDADALCNLGQTLAGRQRLDEAIPLYLEALRIAPTNANAHVALGLALAAAGKLEDAIAHFQEALRQRPDNASAHLNLGRALAAQGKTDEAARQVKEALRLRPNYPQAQQALQAITGQKGP
jgi:protein O-mannosyl-transferase